MAVSDMDLTVDLGGGSISLWLQLKMRWSVSSLGQSGVPLMCIRSGTLGSSGRMMVGGIGRKCGADVLRLIVFFTHIEPSP